MPPVYLKEIWRQIKGSLGRYLSIVCIVGLGTAFFAGIKASAPDMKGAADAHFDDANVQDIQLYSTIGINDDDLEAIRSVEGVQDAQGVFSMDALSKKGSKEMVVKVISLAKDQTINRPRLMEGRMPEKDNECLIEADSVSNELFEGYDISDQIHLYSGTDTPLSDDLKETVFTVVGKAYNPNYLSYEKGTSAIGSGSVDTFIYIPQENVKADYFTEADVVVKGAKELDTYSDEYFDTVEPIVHKLEDLSDRQISAFLSDRQKTLDDDRDEMNSQLDEAQAKLQDARKQLDDGKGELEKGLAEIKANKEKLASSKTELDAGWNEYYSSKNQVESGLAQVNEGISQIEAAQARLPGLNSQKDSLNSAISGLETLNASIEQVSQLQNQLTSLQNNLNALLEADPENPQIEQLKMAIAQMEEQISMISTSLTGTPGLNGDQILTALNQKKDEILASIGSVENAQAMIRQIDDGISQIETQSSKLNELKQTKAALESAQAQLPAALATLQASQAQYDSGNSQLAEAENQLNDSRNLLSEKEKDYQKGLDEYEKQKADGEKQINEAQKQIDDLDPQWIVLDRNSHYSFRDYESCADRMDGIASVFPVFFFLVAALVCMTTMTRMVEEERTSIGTLKALGYSKTLIAAKYLIYAGSASLIGCIAGGIIGMHVFPWIIFGAWNSMYNLEGIKFIPQPMLLFESTAMLTGIVLLATIYSIYKELMEVPAQLMRPKAGKAGKKILLERIPFLWRKIPFMHKVTLRNLFRYKKRFFMTVIGIAGCSALLVAGFGINDSISNIIPAQFEDIYHYDGSITADLEKREDLLEKVRALPEIADAQSAEVLAVTVNYDSKDVAANLNIVDDPQAYEKIMSFMDPSNSDELMEFPDQGVFLSIKTAEKMNLSKGDELVFKTSSGKEIHAKLMGIFDQYIDHQIFVSRDQYEKWQIDEKPALQINFVEKDPDTLNEDELGSTLMNMEGIKSVSFFTSLQTNFLNMISSIKMVVVVLVISAALLAFVVLYNLSNVNISERTREIATIKVLGFTEKEVNQYVNRESLILAVIGAAIGLLMGIYLHGMIMNLAEMDSIRFGRTIYASSFMISFALTIFFSICTSWIMRSKLRKIEMVESLKAIE